jgi:putative transposase
MTAPAFLPIVPGSMVSSSGRAYRITHVLGLESVLAEDLATGIPERLHIGDLRPAPVDTAAVGAAPPPDGADLETVDQADWAVAQRRMAVIKPLLNDPFRTREMVEAAAAAAEVHFTTVYEWMRLFHDAGHLSALIPRRRGRKKGTKVVEAAVEAVIAAAIRDEYLNRQKKKPARVIAKVAEVCRTAGIEAPHPNTVRKRIHELPVATALRRRGQRDVARNRHEPVRGPFPGADYPLAVVQIDHSPTDVIVLEGTTRRPLGRPWITLAIDVHTRMVVGFHLSMFNPSAFAAGACLVQAMQPKRELLARMEVPGDWPVFGKMDVVHADNAREFKGEMLRRACDEYRIELKLRPIKNPHYGGHIERLMGTIANELRNLPGATFSSPAARRGYNSDKEAALTFDELEAYLADFIVSVYNKRFHNGIGMSPQRKMEIGILGDGDTPGRGLPDPPGDAERMRLDFLPFEERTVQTYGLVLDGVHYWDEVLTPWINAMDPGDARCKRAFVVRRDPRLISPVYFWDPEVGTYYEIPYRDAARPPTSLWALREARQMLTDEGRTNIDEPALFEALARLEKRITDAKGATKAARRGMHRAEQTRRAQEGKGDAPRAPLPLPAAVAALPDASFGNIFAEPVKRHANIDLNLGRAKG